MNSQPISRRRFVQLAATYGAMAALPLSACVAAPSREALVEWQGIALGAQAKLTLAHPDKYKAEKAIAHCVAEIERLENIFSLYREDSALCRLNKFGKLQAPPAELVEVIAVAVEYGHQSNGLFDITIQPLWQLYHQHFQQNGADAQGPSKELVATALRKVNYQNINFSADEIYLEPEMALTLNGIAQGYITDKIAALLKEHGFENALINLGEYQALGQHPSSRHWKLALASPAKPWEVVKELEMPAGKAVATSSAYGTRWSDKLHHLLSAKTGEPVQTDYGSVSVIADNAMQADALATIFALQSKAQVQKMLKRQDLKVSALFV